MFVFSELQLTLISDIVSNAFKDGNYTDYIAYVPSGSSSDLVIVLSNDITTSSYTSYSVSSGRQVTVNMPEDQAEGLDLGYYVSDVEGSSYSFDSGTPVATNLYDYAINPVAWLNYFHFEINPEFTVPAAEVTIDNTTDIQTALNNYVPSVFITSIAILLAILICIKIVSWWYHA